MVIDLDHQRCRDCILACNTRFPLSFFELGRALAGWKSQALESLGKQDYLMLINVWAIDD